MNNRSNYEYSQKDSIKQEAQDKRSGVLYRASGNLFIVKECNKAVPSAYSGSVRGAIRGFSPGAGTRMRRYLRECLSEYTTMVTLTYPFSFPVNGRETKEHLRRFLQELKREYYRHAHVNASSFKDHSSFWFLEFQERGAPHYHIFTTWCPDKEWVSRRWYDIVESYDERHLRAGTRTEFLRSGRAGTIAYASKYAAKLEQKEVPENFEDVGRFWGVHGRRSVMSATTYVDIRRDTFERVYSARKSMFMVLNSLVFEGRAEVLFRMEGSLVVNLLDKYAQMRMRAEVARLGAMTGRFEDLFCDAEVEEGQTLSGNFEGGGEERLRSIVDAMPGFREYSERRAG